MIIINYYPGSLGDTVIAQLSGLTYIKDQTNRILLEYPSTLKHTDFYFKPLTEQKPSSTKGRYIKKAVMSSSMGPGIPVEVGASGSSETED
jgi:hypothetical protein